MFHKVNAIKALPGYKLLVDFTDGTQREYDVNPLFQKWEAFQNLREVSGLFERVNVDPGGFGVSWNDEIDLACDELWENGKEVVLNE